MIKTTIKSSKEDVVAKGKIFELVHIQQSDGRVFEVARRAPGVRLIIADKQGQTMLLTREYRKELGGYDYRLPGGKVFDTLDEYIGFRSSNSDIHKAAKDKAIAEGSEEAGIDIEELNEFSVSTLGATVEWDIYVFEVVKWSKNESGQHLEVGEDIDASNWYSYEQVESMIMNAEIQEERIALILLRWIKLQKRGNL